METDTTMQTSILRAMTPAQRLKVMESLYWQARAFKTASLKSFHPDWPDEKIKTEVRKLFLYGTTD